MTCDSKGSDAPSEARARSFEGALGATPAKAGGVRLVVSRRRWVQSAASVLGLSCAVGLLRRSSEPSSAASAISQSPSSGRVPGFQARLFSLEQALLVEDLAAHILPEDDRPGALGAGVPAYIEDIVRDVYDVPEQQAFLRGLDAISIEARAAHGRAFHECAPGDRRALLARAIGRCEPLLDSGEPWCFFQAFRALCIEGFCQSRRGATEVLQYESVPGAYQGCVSLSEVGRAWATW